MFNIFLDFKKLSYLYVLKSFIKFTGKYLCRNLFLIKFKSYRLWCRCFPLNFSKSFFKEQFHSISTPPFCSVGGQLLVPNFEMRGSEKNECLEGLKSSCHKYLPGGAGLLCSLSKMTV